jgi:hypothetical protein
VVEAAINRSVAVQGTSQTIRNARVKLGKKAANILRAVKANKTSPGRVARILIDSPTGAMIRTEGADKPNLFWPTP